MNCLNIAIVPSMPKTPPEGAESNAVGSEFSLAHRDLLPNI